MLSVQQLFYYISNKLYACMHYTHIHIWRELFGHIYMYVYIHYFVAKVYIHTQSHTQTLTDDGQVINRKKGAHNWSAYILYIYLEINKMLVRYKKDEK